VLEQAFLEGLQTAFWPLYVTAVGASGLAFALRRQWCLGRTVAALVFASLAQTAVEGLTGSYLLWWQHMMIDVPVFIMVTMPPRHYWQATMGGLVFAQLFMHAVWGMAPDLARAHWLAVTLIGFAKCGVLLAWSGGARVETLLGRAARFASRLVPASLKGSVA
jgi:Na+-transporting NADH:ubiquinone oxidoreductase subunit NqrB